ncbi:uncharacterized protein LOC127866175 isoform X2 [Dreissena polymorpha]|uniref:uncharacterized protein LOC127866175 isoform X2 n=1 Tax=Dreissena polymorpha TaxID=45954 RepID=UPI002263F741|nr:uncharacterized protein LOC127866175 isoform X2 [Dreissena polymorpha]
MGDNICGFCHTGEENVKICGPLHKDVSDGKSICAHHKCMQYSALLVQYKTDGFGGFKKSDVAKEIRRGAKLSCAICKNDKSKKYKKGATSGCALASCKKTFHYLCVANNPQTMAKRYRVAAGDKVVILYRVFCCQKHEQKYKETLSADDIVGRNQSSDEEDNGVGKSNSKSSDSEDEPVSKKQRVSGSKDSDHDSDKHIETYSSPMTAAEVITHSSPMTAAEVITQTQEQYSELLRKKKKEDKEESICKTSSNDDELTEDFNSSNEPVISAGSSDTEVITSTTMAGDRYNVVIPSKLEGIDIKSLCAKAGCVEDSYLVWPRKNISTGLASKHMPYVMFNLASRLSKQDSAGIRNVFEDTNVFQYDSMISMHSLLIGDNIYKQLFSLCDKVNCKYEREVCRLFPDPDNAYCLILTLTSAFIAQHEIWSAVNVFRWTSSTVFCQHPQKKSPSTSPNQETQILLEWLKPQLKKKSCELSSYPVETTLCLNKAPKISPVAREIEFHLQTASQGLATDVVKVLILRKVDRSIVQFKPYMRAVLENFLTENRQHECFCVIEVLPTDGVVFRSDVVPACAPQGGQLKVDVYTAFNPQERQPSCIVVHKPGPLPE